MKKELSKTDFAIHYLDEQNSVLEQVWTNSKLLMTLDEFKIDMLNYLQFVEEYRTSKSLVNAQQMKFPITPDIQEWIDSVVSERTNKIIRKIAFVVSEQISIQQTMSENEGKKVESKFFEDISEATNWLLQ